MQLQAILSTHPKAHGDADEVGVRATEACFDCTQACVACAEMCRRCGDEMHAARGAP
jgi:hypothetical protein